MVIMFNPAPSTALLTKVREYRGKRKSKRSTLPARTPRRTHHQQPQRNPFQGLLPPRVERPLRTTAIYPRRRPRRLPPPPKINWVQVSARTAGPPPTSRGTHHQQPPRHPFQGLTPSGAEQQLTTTAICPRRPPRQPPPPPKINWRGFRHELLVHRLRAGAHTTSNPQGTLSRG